MDGFKCKSIAFAFKNSKMKKIIFHSQLPSVLPSAVSIFNYQLAVSAIASKIICPAFLISSSVIFKGGDNLKLYG